MYDCDCTPPPHAVEQADQADQEPTQSTGHACWLHATVLVRGLGHFSPPSAAKVTVNVCDCVPPPQVAEQAENWDHEPWQSPGAQEPVLHGCDFEVSVGQAAPPLAAGVCTCHVCFCVPPPQEAEQPDQPVQAPAQSTAHPCKLQACWLTSDSGQAVPPLAGCWVTV